jgi:hypothetical protein
VGTCHRFLLLAGHQVITLRPLFAGERWFLTPAARITVRFLARRVTSASVRGVPRHACDASGLAPQADRKNVRHERAAPARPSAQNPGDQAAAAAPGAGQFDETFSPAIAAALRDLGQDVIAMAERGELRAMSDDDVFAWAISQRRWLLTENVKDFRPILLRAFQADTPMTGILYTSSRAFPRSRKNPGPLIQAIHAWMLNGPPEAPLTEDWLLNPASR